VAHQADHDILDRRGRRSGAACVPLVAEGQAGSCGSWRVWRSGAACVPLVAEGQAGICGSWRCRHSGAVAVLQT